MSRVDEVLQRIAQAKKNIQEAAFENRNKRIKTVNHGHGYITLEIPAAKKHRERHQKRINERNRTANRSE